MQTKLKGKSVRDSEELEIPLIAWKISKHFEYRPYPFFTSRPELLTNHRVSHYISPVPLKSRRLETNGIIKKILLKKSE